MLSVLRRQLTRASITTSISGDTELRLLLPALFILCDSHQSSTCATTKEHLTEQVSRYNLSQVETNGHIIVMI